MNSQSYIVRPKETNIAKKIKENYCESQEKKKAISALIIEVAACALSLKE